MFLVFCTGRFLGYLRCLGQLCEGRGWKFLEYWWFSRAIKVAKSFGIPTLRIFSTKEWTRELLEILPPFFKKLPFPWKDGLALLMDLYLQGAQKLDPVGPGVRRILLAPSCLISGKLLQRTQVPMQHCALHPCGFACLGLEVLNPPYS